MSGTAPGPSGGPRSGAATWLAIQLSMALGIGRSPKAPGTFGSLPGLAVAAAIQSAAEAAGGTAGSLAYHGTIVGLLAAVSALAYWSIGRTEAALGIHDDQRIVIDEVAGQAIAAAWLPLSWISYGIAFALFRLFDITKPGPIGRIDREAPGALGTLGDDLLAGVVAALIAVPLVRFLPA